MFIVLHKKENGVECFINIYEIIEFLKIEDGGTAIFFGKECYEVVEEECSKVNDLIKSVISGD